MRDTRIKRRVKSVRLYHLVAEIMNADLSHERDSVLRNVKRATECRREAGGERESGKQRTAYGTRGRNYCSVHKSQSLITKQLVGSMAH